MRALPTEDSTDVDKLYRGLCYDVCFRRAVPVLYMLTTTVAFMNLPDEHLHAPTVDKLDHVTLASFLEIHYASHLEAVCAYRPEALDTRVDCRSVGGLLALAHQTEMPGLALRIMRMLLDDYGKVGARNIFF